MCPRHVLGLLHLRDKEYFQTMHNSKEHHSLSSPDRVVLSHREGMVANAKGLKEPDRFMACNHFFFRGT